MKTITADNIAETLQGMAGLVIIDFWADWCGPCKVMTPIIEELEQTLEDVYFFKINVTDEPDLARDYRVMSIPTLIFLKNGNEIDRIIGVDEKRNISNKIETIYKHNF